MQQTKQTFHPTTTRTSNRSSQNDLQVVHQPSTKTNCTVLGLQPHFPHGNWHNKPCHTHKPRQSQAPPNKQQQTPHPRKKKQKSSTNKQTAKTKTRNTNTTELYLAIAAFLASARGRKRERSINLGQFQRVLAEKRMLLPWA